MHYLIKQEKCDSCQSLEAMTRPPSLLPADNLEVFRCKCRGSGYIETRADADEWLESKLVSMGVHLENNAYVKYVREQEALEAK